MSRLTVALAILLLPAAAVAETLDSLLSRGPVVLVENDPKGKFAAATGIIAVEAPLERVWSALIDFPKYKEFIPKVVDSTIVEGNGTYDPHVRWEIDTPVFNTKYVVHYHLNEALHSIAAEWVSGALKDSHWDYRLESAGPNRTLVYYKSCAKHFSSLLENVEDSQQSITVGVNVGGSLSLLRALKKHVETAQ